MALRKKKKTLLVQAGGVGLAAKAKPHVDSALSSANDFVTHTAIPALQDARDKAGPALADARDKAAPYVADARDKAAPYVADARDKAREVGTPYAAQARDLTAPYVADVRSKAAPHLATVRDRTAPLVHEAKVKAAPVVAAGAAAAGSRAAAVKDLAEAKVAELTGQPEKKKRSRVKTLLVLAGVAGAAALVAKKLQGSREDPWQSSYTPTPPPSPTAADVPPSPVAADTAVLDDSAGSSPDEALADAADAPRAATTPDDPAEVVDVDGQHKA